MLRGKPVLYRPVVSYSLCVTWVMTPSTLESEYHFFQEKGYCHYLLTWKQSIPPKIW